MALRTLATRKTLASGFQQLRGLQTFSLPDLPYDYGALEPAINGEIMQIHHQKHHQAYVTNYNKALEQLEAAIAKGDASAVVKVAEKGGLAGEDEDGAGQTKIPLGLVMCHAHDQVPLKLNG